MKVKELLDKLHQLDPDSELNLDAEVQPAQKQPKIWFFERPDGVILDFGPQMAWTVQYEYSPTWKQIGASDGELWKSETKEIRKQVEEIKAEMAEFTAQKLPIPRPLTMKFRKMHAEFVKTNNEAIKKELEVARGHVVIPPKNRIVGTPDGIEALRGSKFGRDA